MDTFLQQEEFGNSSEVLKALQQRWVRFYIGSSIIGVIGLIPATIDYQMSFHEERNLGNCKQQYVNSVYLVLVIILTAISVLMVIICRIYFLMWSRLSLNLDLISPFTTPTTFFQFIQKIRSKNIKILFDSKTILWIILLLVIPYPGLDKKEVYFQQNMIQYSQICYFANQILYSLMWVRILILIYQILQTIFQKDIFFLRENRKFYIQNYMFFQIKSHLHDYPFTIITFVFLCPLTIISGVLIRIYQRPLIINGIRQQFQHITSSFWFTIVTTTTAGYGDMIPYTNIGRLITILIFIQSGLIFTFFISTLRNSLILTKQEEQAHKNICLSQSAAKAIVAAFKYSRSNSFSLIQRSKSLKKINKTLSDFKQIRSYHYKHSIDQSISPQEIDELLEKIRLKFSKISKRIRNNQWIAKLKQVGWKSELRFSESGNEE